MINQPKFKSSFHIEVLEERVFLLSETDSVVLNGAIYEQLAQLIDGNRTVDELIEHLSKQVSATEVYYALMFMEQNGYIVESRNDCSPEIEAFWESLNVDGKDAKHRLETTTVSVYAFGAVAATELITCLKSLGIKIDAEGNLAVVLTDDYLQDGLASFNQKALTLKHPWMLVKPVGQILWIGPIFSPTKTGCWQCLAQRLRTNRPIESYIQRQKGISNSFSTSRAVFPSTYQTGLNLAATEIFKWIVRGENQHLEGTLITLDTQQLNTQHHRLVQRPQCLHCGSPNYYNSTSLVLTSRKKLVSRDGGYRCVLPEATLYKYEHHISPITGVVRELKPLPQTNEGVIHSYSAGHNFATMYDDFYFFRQTLRSQSGGKGQTATQAKVSALCEALERYSGVFQGDEIRYRNTYKNLNPTAIHLNTCLNFSEMQYNNRNELNTKLAPNQQIPEPFDEEAEIEWTPVWSLTTGEFKYMSTAYCYYGYPKNKNPFCWANSNGAAAGNTKEEAILQGFMELVERDSVALWWYNRVQRPGVDLESFEDAYIRGVIEYYQTLHREIWVLDITADLTIPAFAAISRRTDSITEDIVFGFGSHFDPKIALLRAITELNQLLPAAGKTTKADGSSRYNFSDLAAQEWWTTATIENQPYLLADPRVKPKVYSDYPLLGGDDLKEDVLYCVELARQQAMEVLVLDQTRPDIGLDVVKVFVPGMRHFWQRLGAGRLYEVPVKLGWLQEPLKEEQLNPFPMFI